MCDYQDVSTDVALCKIVPNKIGYTCILPGSGNTASKLPIVNTKSITYKKNNYLVVSNKSLFDQFKSYFSFFSQRHHNIITCASTSHISIHKYKVAMH